jgi:TetR/AcrR family transcriptional regulator, transcriptional repressor for nem operon
VYTDGVLAVIGDFAVRLAPHDPQSAHAKVLSIYAVMIGAMQLSRALGDRQLADEILEQGAIRDTRPGEPTDANATRRPPA